MDFFLGIISLQGTSFLVKKGLSFNWLELIIFRLGEVGEGTMRSIFLMVAAFNEIVGVEWDNCPNIFPSPLGKTLRLMYVLLYILYFSPKRAKTWFLSSKCKTEQVDIEFCSLYLISWRKSNLTQIPSV